MINQLKAELMRLQQEGQLRSLRSITGRKGKTVSADGQSCLNLSSNDYLGISADIELQKKFFALITDGNILDYYGLSGASSRLLTGNSGVYTELEQYLAGLYGKEAALVFNSGYHANAGIIPALFRRGDLILSDRLNHASIIDGIRLSEAEFLRYPHLDYQRLEAILEEKRGKYKNCVIITESVFSMDGELADLKKLTALKEKYNAVLYIDEAHACGVFGPKGLGLAEQQAILDKVDIFVGTLGKAFGSLGAYAVFAGTYRDYLVNFMRPFIFTTALAPVNLAWTWFVLKQNELLKTRREKLLMLSDRLRTALKDQQLDVRGESQIIPVIVGENEAALKLSEKLRSAGYLLLAVRPPTVPKGTSRIRISLSASLDWSDLEKLPELIR